MSLQEPISLVIVNGTLIDGSGAAARDSDSIVIQGNRIKTVGRLPSDIRLEDKERVKVIDAAGKWVMPGLIDGHCHLSFGFPTIVTKNSGIGASNPEFSTLRAAQNAQTVLRSGVTSVSVPGGAWFIDVGLRDAIKAKILEGPRIYCAGRFIATYGSIGDTEPSWVGTPEHSHTVLANSVTEMVMETRRQLKHGVDFIKLVDSFWGDEQTIAPEELKAVVAEAHRRNAPVAIHSRGSASTRAAAEAGVDWIMHADQVSEADLEVVAERGISIMPTAFFIKHALDLGREGGKSSSELELLKRAWDGIVNMLQISRKLGIKMLCGTDTGATPIAPYGKYHANEAEILTKYGGYTTIEAITAITKNNALTVGLENDLGVIQPGKLADLLILNSNPLDDIRILQDRTYLMAIIKDGKTLMEHGNVQELNQMNLKEGSLQFQEARI